MTAEDTAALIREARGYTQVAIAYPRDLVTRLADALEAAEAKLAAAKAMHRKDYVEGHGYLGSYPAPPKTKGDKTDE